MTIWLSKEIDNLKKIIRTPDGKVLSLKRKGTFQKGRIQVSNFSQLSSGLRMKCLNSIVLKDFYSLPLTFILEIFKTKFMWNKDKTI